MADKVYQVVVTGQLMPGAQPEQVQARVAALFNAPAAKLAPLFAGGRVVVKKGLDEAAAQRYVAALRDAGLVAVAEAPGGTDAAPAPPTLAPVGATLVEAPVIPPADIDTSALSVAAAGGDLVEFTPPPVPAIDTSHLRVDPPGTRLIEAPAVAEPEFDISALSIAAPGAQLADAPAVAAPAIDTSGLDLAPAGSDVGESRRRDFPPPPDTSHLKLDSPG